MPRCQNGESLVYPISDFFVFSLRPRVFRALGGFVFGRRLHEW